MSDFKVTTELFADIVSYIKKHYAKLSYALIADTNLAITPSTSRIGGLPYFDSSKIYPCDVDGNPLRFICQINLQEIHNTPLDSALQTLKIKDNVDKLAKKGLLQFYALNDDTFGCAFKPTNNNKYCVVYFENLNTNLTMEELRLNLASYGLDEAIISNISTRDDYWPITGQIALRFKAIEAIPNYGDFELSNQVLTKAYNAVLNLDIPLEDNNYEVLDALEDFLIDDNLMSNTRTFSKQERNQTIGYFLGYPDFTQDNPIYDNESLERFDSLLLCLDGSSKIGNNFNMMWGDCGIANFFINSKKLALGDFTDIFYTWDCC